MDRITDLAGLEKTKGFKMVHLNVRSIFKKMDQIRVMFNGSKLDVISFSETWLNKSVNSKSVDLEGYTLLRQDRNFSQVKKKRGGGLLTYIRSDHAADCEFLADISKSSKDIEALWSIIYRPHCKNLVICNIYRPPTGDLGKAIEYLEECFQFIDVEKVEICIMGDVNVNYKKKTSKEYKKLKFFEKSNGLSQVINNTTRNSDRSNSLLDLILTNSIYVKEAGTLDHFISDHQPVFIVKKKSRDTRPTVEFEGRSYRHFDKNILKRELLNHNWGDFYQIDNPDEAWKYILDRFVPVIDDMCPIRVFKIKNYRPDWMTTELIEQIKDRDYFYSKAKASKDEDDWRIAKHLRNVTNANIRQARKEFIQAELRTNSTDYKKFWKTIRSVIPSDKGNSKQDILLAHEGKKLPKDKVADHINNYFVNIGKQIKVSMQVPPSDANADASDNNWALEEFTETEVFKAVQSINISKSSGLENISSFIVKEVFTILTSQITYLFNLSVRTSQFPDAWKKALVIPIPKSGNLSLVQNFRPISLLPIPGKLLEKLIHKQLSNHLDNISYLTEYQHGFRKNHSTIHSVGQLTNYIYEKMDRKLPVLAAFIDFRKAFDCVQHPVLINKLSSIGLDSRTLGWFTSYLSNRQQYVLANNTHSSLMTITQGVPQGSVLGPLFYIIYANDIVSKIKNCNIALYADDTVLYMANRDFVKTTAMMQKDLDALSLWCVNNGISMNVDKTKLMLFGQPKKIKELPAFDVVYNGSPIRTVSTYKYLGVTMDSQLNFNMHVQRTIATVTDKLKQFRRMRFFLDTKAAVLVYKNMILPLLEYGDIFLTGTTVDNRRKLQVLQNKGIRCALNRDRETSISDLHSEIQLSKLNKRRELHLLNYMFDLAQNDSNLKKLCNLGVKTRSHNKKLLKIRKPVTEKFKKSTAYKGPKNWNELPEEFHHLDTRKQFSGKMKLRLGMDSGKGPMGVVKEGE